MKDIAEANMVVATTVLDVAVWNGCDRGTHWTCVRSGSGIFTATVVLTQKHVTVARTMPNTRHGRSNTPNGMETIPGHLEGWRQMHLRHCGVVRWTDISSDIRLSCPTVIQTPINICAL